MNKTLLFFLLITFFGKTQTFQNKHFGASIGAVLQIGTHVNNIGININGFYQDYFFQLNSGSTLTFNLTSYGMRKNFIEYRQSFGLLLLAGKKEIDADFQLNSLTHNSRYNYALGYNYIIYLDNAKTSQLSGAFGLHIKYLSFFFENDVFGAQAKDRFRSGHLNFSYRYLNVKFQSGLYIWTGETKPSIWNNIPLKKCPSGYRNLEDLPYGKTSHGITYAGLIYDLGYGQFLNSKIGFDSEHIRHAFQNRLIHDMIFLPKKIIRNTPHYPRLDNHGCITFDKKMVRKDKFYLQISSNENWSN